MPEINLEEKKGKAIKEIPAFRQRYMMNCAIVSLESQGKEFSAKMDIISMLMSLVGKETLKEYFKTDYEIALRRIENLKKYVFTINSYLIGLKKEVINSEDLRSKRYLAFRKALSYCYDYIFFIDEVWVFLLSKTDLKDVTIPSNYWLYLSKEQGKEMPREAIDSLEIIGEE